jgi:ParB/RepB/Spo0J family partition protein
MALKKDGAPRRSKSDEALAGYLDTLLPMVVPEPTEHRAIRGAVMVKRARINAGENIREDAKANLHGFHDGIMALKELGLGIEGTGILQPLIGVDNGESIDLIFGFRRYWSTEFSHDELPVLLVPDPEAARVVMQVIENHSRKGFNLREEIAAVQAMQAAGNSIRQIVKLMGEGKHWVENRVNLAKAKPDVQELINKYLDAPGVTINNLLLIETINNPKLREKMVEAAKGELTERQLREHINPTPREPKTSSKASGANSSGGNGSAGSSPPEEEPKSTGDVILDRLRLGVKGLSEAAAILEGGQSTVELRKAVDQEIAQAKLQLARVEKAARRK